MSGLPVKEQNTDCTFSYHAVAWCIANSETSEVVEVFLSTMKVRSPMTPVRVLMTDDGELNKFA